MIARAKMLRKYEIDFNSGCLGEDLVFHCQDGIYKAKSSLLHVTSSFLRDLTTVKKITPSGKYFCLDSDVEVSLPDASVNQLRILCEFLETGTTPATTKSAKLLKKALELLRFDVVTIDDVKIETLDIKVEEDEVQVLGGDVRLDQNQSLPSPPKRIKTVEKEHLSGEKSKKVESTVYRGKSPEQDSPNNMDRKSVSKEKVPNVVTTKDITMKKSSPAKVTPHYEHLNLRKQQPEEQVRVYQPYVQMFNTSLKSNDTVIDMDNADNIEETASDYIDLVDLPDNDDIAVGQKSWNIVCMCCSKSCDSVEAYYNHCLGCYYNTNEDVTCPFPNCLYKAANTKVSLPGRFSALCDHIRSKHTAENVYICNQCDKSFSSQASLRYHTSQHYDKNKFYCIICDHFWPTEKYNEHMKKHQALTSDVIFRCSKCPKEFKSTMALSYHESIHTQNFKYPCDICDKKFHQKNHLLLHKRTHEGFAATDDKKYNKNLICPLCEKSCKTVRLLRKHIREDCELFGVAEFRCTIDGCDKVIQKQNIRKKQLDLYFLHLKRNHIIGQAKKSNFPCSACDQTFKRQGNLRIHELTHSGEPNVKCELCDQKFHHSSFLKFHMKKHKNGTDQSYG